ncbi:MAG TPA: IclR family transcriptional regulator [Actinomycetota bacterium]|nr:IclR family transcriptional regulator [Actinomycetota bacterium]
MAREAQGQTIVAIERAADVLALFADADEPTLGVTEIAQALNLSKAVVYRILSSFRAKGFIELDEASRRYTLGPRALHLGLAFVNRTEVPRVARPVLEALSRETHETATLSLRTGDRRVYVDQVTPDRDVKMVVQLGLSVPLHAGASSKAFLAYLDEDEQTDYLTEPLERLTGLTITSRSALAKELKDIRDRGYAMSLGERMEGAGSVAAPVFSHDGKPAAVISVCGPLERFRGEATDLAKKLLDATDRLSRRLGYRP